MSGRGIKSNQSTPARPEKPNGEPATQGAPIFCNVPQYEALATLPRVNRQFNAVLCAPSAVWEELKAEVLQFLSVDGTCLPLEEHIDSLERWLRQRGAAVKMVTCDSWGDADVVPYVVPLIRGLPELEEFDTQVLSPFEDSPLCAASSRACRDLFRTLQRCRALKRVTVSLRVSNDKSLAGTVGQLSQLQSLSLRLLATQKFATASLGRTFSALSSLARLTCLAFQQPLNDDYDDSRVVVPAALACLQELRVLRFSYTGWLVLEAGWARLPALETLEFHHCLFVPADDQLPGVAALTALKRFEIQSCGSLRTFPGAFSLVSLEELRVSGCNDVYQGMPDLQLPADICALTNLRALEFAGEGVRACPGLFPGLASVESLEVLCPNLWETPVPDLQLTRLRTLRLGLGPESPRSWVLDRGQVLDVTALGDLAGVPGLTRLQFESCVVRVGAGFANASAGLEEVCFVISVPEPGASMAAVLELQRVSRLRGCRAGVVKFYGLEISSESTHSMQCGAGWTKTVKLGSLERPYVRGRRAGQASVLPNARTLGPAVRDDCRGLLRGAV